MAGPGSSMNHDQVEWFRLISYFTNVGGNQVADELFHVVVDSTTFLDGGHDGGEVVVGQDHLGGGFSDGSTGTHGDTNFGLLQGGSVVDTITSHGRNLVHALQVFNDLGLVGRFDTGEEASSAASGALLFGRQVVEFAAREGKTFGAFLFGEDADTAADSFGGGFVVTSDDNDADTGLKRTAKALQKSC